MLSASPLLCRVNKNTLDCAVYILQCARVPQNRIAHWLATGKPICCQYDPATKNAPFVPSKKLLNVVQGYLNNAKDPRLVYAVVQTRVSEKHDWELYLLYINANTNERDSSRFGAEPEAGRFYALMYPHDVSTTITLNEPFGNWLNENPVEFQFI